jgi:hypothetical protein
VPSLSAQICLVKSAPIDGKALIMRSVESRLRGVAGGRSAVEGRSAVKGRRQEDWVDQMDLGVRIWLLLWRSMKNDDLQGRTKEGNCAGLETMILEETILQLHQPRNLQPRDLQLKTVCEGRVFVAEATLFVKGSY